MGFVALKVLGDKKPGDSIPEAQQWRSLYMHIRAGNIAAVADGQEDEFRKHLLAGKRPPLWIAPNTTPQHFFLARKRLEGMLSADMAKASASLKKPAPKPVLKVVQEPQAAPVEAKSSESPAEALDVAHQATHVAANQDADKFAEYRQQPIEWLRNLAASKGIELDGRWGKSRVIEVIIEAGK